MAKVDFRKKKFGRKGKIKTTDSFSGQRNPLGGPTLIFGYKKEFISVDLCNYSTKILT